MSELGNCKVSRAPMWNEMSDSTKTDLILRPNDRHQPLVGWMELVMLFINF